MYFNNFALPDKKQDEGEREDYTRTPGIDVTKKSVKGVGQLRLWDCAGQIEYSVTHGMFLGSGQSLFIVAYNLQELEMEQMVKGNNLSFLSKKRNRSACSVKYE